MAAAAAGVHRDVADANCEDLHLPEAHGWVRDGEPPERRRDAVAVVAAEHDGPVGGTQGDGEVRQQARRGIHQALEEAAQRAGGEALQGEAQDAVVRHEPKGPVGQAGGSEHGQARARLASACSGAQADVVTDQHAPGRALPEVGLGELHCHDRALHAPLGQALAPRHHVRAVRVHVDSCVGLPRRVASVRHAGRAVARLVGQQHRAGPRVEQDAQLLGRAAHRDVADEKGLRRSLRAPSRRQGADLLQAHFEWTHRLSRGGSLLRHQAGGGGPEECGTSHAWHWLR
mmetsp:Transcript_112683/g.313447  ORF Transcript_112683/g.313447 Transcript_112683/m.313447 type:complete len:287 (-) Transcript_112683:67-927(-)